MSAAIRIGPQHGRVPMSVRKAGVEAEYRQRLRDGFDWCGREEHEGSRWVRVGNMGERMCKTCAARRDRSAKARRKERVA